MASKRSPATGSNRKPSSARTRTPLRRALMRVVSTARRETSTAVTAPAPRRAAQMASAPLPVHRSSTDALGGSVCSRRRSASSQLSLMGRNTPGSVTSFTGAFYPPPGARKRMPPPPPTTSGQAGLRADELRARFDAQQTMTVGLEEEVMILDPDAYGLVAAADDVLEAVAGDARFKRELPAAQVELVAPPAATVRDGAAELLAARRALVAAVGGRFAFGAAGV